MREPDRRRRSGRALGAMLALVAMASTLGVWIPGAWAQTVEPPPPTETATPPPTVEPPPPPTVEPPPTTSEPPPTSEPAPQTDPPAPDPSGGGQGGGVWSPTESPAWATVREDREDPLRRWRDWTPTPGTYDTSYLDRFAARMRERGWSEGRVRREVYAPFIVVGPATWSDSWGALRLVAGPRPHRGQDVLCTYGAPVLATEPGTVTWSTNTLGGLAAYLNRPGGGFYYYAHLSGTPQGLPQGSRVSVGDVIGYCGATGNASVPHVHFSYVTASGVSVDPMDRLRGWLEAAERRLPNPPPARPLEEPVEVSPDTTQPAWDTAPSSIPAIPAIPEPPASVATSAAAALDSPVTVPVATLLLGLPLLGLLRRRTREPFG